MSNEKSFALYATLTTPVGTEHDYQPFVTYRDGKTYTIWVRAELHDCNYDEAMGRLALREGENVLNTQPSE